MRMRLVLTVALVVAAAAAVRGAAPDFTIPWLSRAGGRGSDIAYGIASDVTGVYIMGSAVGPADDTNYRAGTSAVGISAQQRLADAPLREPTADAAAGAGSAWRHRPVRTMAFDNRTDNRNEDLIVQKYSHDGVLLWTARGGGLSSDIGQGISVSNAGRAVFVCGYTISSIQYWGQYTTYNRGSVDSFLVRLNADTGAFEWATTFGGAGDDWATSVAVNLDTALSSNFLYVVGDHNSVPYHFGSCTLNVSYGQYDVHIARVNSQTGDCIWLMTGGGPDDDIPWSAFVRDTDGMLLVSGHLHSDTAVLGRADMRVSSSAAAPFAFGPANVQNFTNLACCTRTGLADLMLLQIDPAAAIQYFATGGSPGPEESIGVGFDSSGNAYAVGTCEDRETLRFGPFVLPTFTGQRNGYLVRVNVTGGFTYALSFPGVYPTALTVDTDGTCFVSGDFDPATVTVGGPLSGSTSGAAGIRVDNTLSGAASPRTKDAILFQVDALPTTGQVVWALGGGGVRDDTAQGVVLVPLAVAQRYNARRRIVFAGQYSSTTAQFGDALQVTNANFADTTGAFVTPDIFVAALNRELYTTSAAPRTAGAAAAVLLVAAAAAVVALL